MEENKKYIETMDKIYKIYSDEKNTTNELYNEIKDNLIDPGCFTPEKMIYILCDVGELRLRFRHAYIELMQRIYEEYQCIHDSIIKYLSSYDSELNNTVDEAIINDDEEAFMKFMNFEIIDIDGLFKDCCLYGAENIFKLLRTKYNMIITKECLDASFKGNNSYIINECLKRQNPDKSTMKAAIESHNIYNVIKLSNEYNIEISYIYCEIYYNLHALLIYLNQTNDFHSCLFSSPSFGILSLCKYLLSNDTINNYYTVHNAINENQMEIAKYLILNDTDIIHMTMDKYGTLLDIAVTHNATDLVELLVSLGADINIKGQNMHKLSLLHFASIYNNKKVVEILISNGAEIDENMNSDSTTPLHAALTFNNKEIAQYLISHGANIHKKRKI
ncbi:hypothetical protein TVAG_158430 [Trichomonas vaginalis G3]|uniref:DUF3447 domain-containing protein n=1 Tax=Trichomonas vaginalis (strain ATCC PRA-98 / G3) TaxID=412133 RepID=A2FP54_TRIV3|nr:spectrin binding [Trichomonas vaginalis G3]EAX93324.1 hypothetical protein TVAG_158430 [Trichomonas vaginalis G3]KAI5517067.1 spectrin binding [Trichomonas vaginalis G3]|eukprot:XP_001306254.1 hypothetical protein [Trichomonas vaginalis G3]